jgi:hypothetical protein
MFALADPQTFWLNLTNLALGAATLFLFFLSIALPVGRAVVVRLKKQSRLAPEDSAPAGSPHVENLNLMQPS